MTTSVTPLPALPRFAGEEVTTSTTQSFGPQARPPAAGPPAGRRPARRPQAPHPSACNAFHGPGPQAHYNPATVWNCNATVPPS